MSVIAIETNKFYRNEFGMLVLIVGEIKPGNRWYDRGFRFVDHLNSYYTAEGTLNSKLFSKLNLVTEVPAADVTPEEMDGISKIMVKRIKKYLITKKVLLGTCDVMNFLIPISAGLNMGVGIANIAVRPLMSLLNISLGVASMVQYHDFNWEERRKQFV